MSFQRPRRPSSKQQETKTGGLFSLVDGLGKRQSVSAAGSRDRRAFAHTKSFVPAGLAPDIGPVGTSTDASSPMKSFMPPLGATRQAHSSQGTRPKRETPTSAFGLRPPLPVNRPSTQQQPQRSSSVSMPSLSSAGSPNSRQQQRGSTGSAPPSRGGNGSAEFHRGLVGALHEVLRKQRSGVFPTGGLEGEVQREMRDRAAASAALNNEEGVRSSMQTPHPTEATLGRPPPSRESSAQQPRRPPATPSSMSRRDSIEAQINAKKNLFQQKRWRTLQRDGRMGAERDYEQHGLPPRANTPGGTPVLSEAENQAWGGEFLHPKVIDALIETDRKEMRERGSILLHEERERATIESAFRHPPSPPESPPEATSSWGAPAEVLKAQATKAYESGDFLAAHRCYSRAIDVDPSNPVLLTNRAAAAMMLMNYDGCIKDCLKAAAIDSNHLRAFARLGHAYALLGNFNTAKKHYTTAQSLAAAQQHRSSAALVDEAADVALVERARRLLDQGAHGDAAAVLDELKSFGHDPPVKLLRLQALLVANPPLARTELGKFLQSLPHPADIDPTDTVPKAAITAFYCEVQIHLARACAYCGQHYLSIAHKHIDASLAILPEFRPAIVLRKSLQTVDEHLRRVSSLLGDPSKRQEAHAAITAALAIDPHNRKIRASLFAQRAELASQQDNHAAAVVDYTNALECDSGMVKALIARATSFAAIGDFSSAVSDLEKAVSIRPELAEDLAAMRSRRQKEEADAAEFASHRQQQYQQRANTSQGPRPRGSGTYDSYFNGLPRRPASGNPTRCHYEVLQVPRFASVESIKAQYRRLTLKFHPDKVVSQPAEVQESCAVRFKEISHAYSVLSDRAQKTSYDLDLGMV